MFDPRCMYGAKNGPCREIAASPRIYAFYYLAASVRLVLAELPRKSPQITKIDELAKDGRVVTPVDQ